MKMLPLIRIRGAFLIHAVAVFKAWALLLFVIEGLLSTRAAAPRPSELAACRAWLDEFLGASPGGAGAGNRQNWTGFSFRYGGESHLNALRGWAREARETRTDENLTERQIVYREQGTGFEVRLEALIYHDFPAVEWVIHLTNRGTNTSPMVEEIQAWNGRLPVSKAQRLHWNKGGVASFDDFAPVTEFIKPGFQKRWTPGGGRSSSQVLPFFNLEGEASGVIAAIGWSGEWAAEFACDDEQRVTLSAGMDKTHLRLFASESIRTPRMLLLFYEGDRWRGQNLLRQFFLAHHRPTRNGQPLVAPVTCGNWGGTRAEVHLDNIQKIQRQGLPVEYYWIDAEWYGQGNWPVSVGDWQVKTNLYPAGFKPLSDALRGSGRELMLWFEPERVYRGTPWERTHREWLMDQGGDSLLLNLGLPAAREFLTQFISEKINEFGLGCYRQDFNIEPLPFWRAADAPDRQGIAEIRYIEGLYAFWDGLQQRHPGLIIDNCASGGRRIDLETIGRATPFWRSDGPRDAIAHQCHTFGLLPWVPLSATSQDRAGDDYEFRSSMCSALCLNWWISGDAPAERIPENFPFGWAKKSLDRYLDLRPFYYGDFYPLTGYSQANDVWMAYQLDRPGAGDGLVIVLRRPGSPYETARFQLQQMAANARYQVTDLDSREALEWTGRDLISPGLRIVVGQAPGSALFTYRRMP